MAGQPQRLICQKTKKIESQAPCDAWLFS